MQLQRLGAPTPTFGSSELLMKTGQAPAAPI